MTTESVLIDAVVIALNPLDVTFFGSATNQVVRRASSPVLTLKQ